MAIDKQGNSNHPPAIIRTIANITTIAQTLHDFAGWNFRETLESLKPLIGGIIRSIDAIVPGRRREMDSETFVEGSIRLISQYDATLYKFEPYIRPYVRGTNISTETLFYRSTDRLR